MLRILGSHCRAVNRDRSKLGGRARSVKPPHLCKTHKLRATTGQIPFTVRAFYIPQLATIKSVHTKARLHYQPETFFSLFPRTDIDNGNKDHGAIYCDQGIKTYLNRKLSFVFSHGKQFPAITHCPRCRGRTRPAGGSPGSTQPPARARRSSTRASHRSSGGCAPHPGGAGSR